MIEAVIKTKSGEALNMELPIDRLVLYEETFGIGAGNPQYLCLSDDEDKAVSVKLYGNSVLGSSLLMLLSKENSLADANRLALAVTNAHELIKSELEQKIIENHYVTMDDLYSDMHKMLSVSGQAHETYYFPLHGYVEGDYYGTSYEADNDLLLEKMEEICGQLKAEQGPEYGDMASYFYGDDCVKEKLISAVWDAEIINGELYGKVDAVLREKLEPEEEEILKDWIEGQNSDGFGEGFEQRPFDVEEGALYVSMWSSDEDYFIYNSEEMCAYMSPYNGMDIG